jgi:hypothetical protein
MDYVGQGQGQDLRGRLSRLIVEALRHRALPISRKLKPIDLRFTIRYRSLMVNC